jgi:hypothetical protein
MPRGAIAKGETPCHSLSPSIAKPGKSIQGVLSGFDLIHRREWLAPRMDGEGACLEIVAARETL